jgi:hypothetical protein
MQLAREELNSRWLQASAPATLDVRRDLQRLVLKAAIHGLHLQLEAYYLEAGTGAFAGQTIAR